MHNMDERIEPHKVTKPIQLLAAWLLGLIVVDGSFLSAAAMLKQPSWAPNLLVIAAVCNVPLFLVSLFLLQTRFRPEMQEDSYYSKYLEVARTTGKPESLATDLQVLRSTVSESNTRTVEVVERLQTQVIEIARQVSGIAAHRPPVMEAITNALEAGREDIQERKREIQWQAYWVGVNDLLPNYKNIVARLNEARIPIADTFGSSSNVPRPPAHYVVAFGPGVEIEALRQLLRVLAGTGIEFLDYASRDEIHQGRLYVGGYAYDQDPVLNLDGGMLDRVTHSETIEGVLSLMAQNPTRLKSVF